MNNMIYNANMMFKNCMYEQALEMYKAIKIRFPELGRYIDINISKTEKLLSSYQRKLVLHVPHKIKLLLVGRTHSYTKGGIHRSCNLISSYMVQMGHTVIEHDTQNPLPEDLHGINLCIIYTGDPIRPDFETVDHKIQILQSAGIPVLVNLSYNMIQSRTEYIIKKILEYNKNKKSPVLVFFFTESAALDPRFSEIENYTCTIPKTIQLNSNINNNSFYKRNGICIGDVSKLQNREIFGGNPQVWIDAIKTSSPKIDIYAYKQYSCKEELKNIIYVPYMKDDFFKFLSERRIFVSLARHCTFEMVPCEAQFCGVPLIYRYMPQSLSEVISSTGISVRTPAEAAYMVSWLYNDARAWNNFSYSSIYNAKSKNIDILSSSIEGYIKLALFRALSINNRNY